MHLKKKNNNETFGDIEGVHIIANDMLIPIFNLVRIPWDNKKDYVKSLRRKYHFQFYWSSL